MSGPITKLWHMVRGINIKHVVVSEGILDEFSVGHYGIKVKVTIALAKFNHYNFPDHQQMALHCTQW